MKQADNNKKNKHLTAQDRQEIMNGLDKAPFICNAYPQAPFR